ncbi:MAG: hypothetical protein ACI4FZ_06285 [Lachnospiraceae bacterium]
MANIVDILRSKYNVDIKEINLIKLYKIESPDISNTELEAKFAERREKWKKSINGANEKFAERDQAYLNKANDYEKILRDAKLRRELFDFYNGKSSSVGGEVNRFTKKYFEIVSTTGKIDKDIVSFFFDYFTEERKNKKVIVEFLKKEYKLLGFSENENAKDDTENEDTKEERKKNSFLVTNLFQKKTLLQIHKCESLYALCRDSHAIKTKYSRVTENMEDFLELDKYADYEAFKAHIECLRTEAYNVRQEKGEDYLTMVDFVNGISTVLSYNDIKDNFEEFKLLIKYPSLTPYMFGLGMMKKKSLDALFEVAETEYGFRNLDHFLLSYFNRVYNNFGISVEAIQNVMKAAEKKAGQNNALNAIEKVFGVKKKKKVRPEIRRAYYMTYWPIYVLKWIFGIIKFFFNNIKVMSIGLFAIITLCCFFVLDTGLLDIRSLFSSGFKWVEYLDATLGLPKTNWFSILLKSIEIIIAILLIYIGPGSTVALFVYRAIAGLHKKFDMVGIERSIEKILDGAYKRMEEKYEDYQNNFFIKCLPAILTNIVLTVLLSILSIVLILL